MKDSWDCVSTEVVKKSFITCGISVSTDGSEDGEIHCLKESGIAAAARPAIEQATAALLAPRADGDESDSDLFADLDDEDDDNELACNKIIIEDC